MNEKKYTDPIITSGSTSSMTAITHGLSRSGTCRQKIEDTTCARSPEKSKPLASHNIVVTTRSILQVNTDPMISMTGHLDVVVPPTIIDEESSPSTVSVREKHNASLICKSHGVKQLLRLSLSTFCQNKSMKCKSCTIFAKKYAKKATGYTFILNNHEMHNPANKSV